MLAPQQRPLIDFLAANACATDSAAMREVIETHISTVLLCGDRAFKLKHALRLAFLDFSTPQLRLAACERELQLNRRTAPMLYRRVRPIVRRPDGSLALDADGDLIDAVLEMQRFDQASLFDRMALDGRLTPDLMTRLAARIADFHGQAEPVRTRGGAAVLGQAMAINSDAIRRRDILGPDREAVLARFDKAFAAQAARLDRRGQRGLVRHCHGDLHLRNICLYQGEPVPFDCIEFNDDLAIVDVLYDLAFLLMDLWHRGLSDLCNLVFNRYLDATGDEDDLGLMPLFLAVRAAVRAHVTAAQAAGAQDGRAQEARDYLALAGRLLEPSRQHLVAIGGLSGTGKSTAAALLAPHLAMAPGARILSTDRLRKQMFGRAPTEKLPDDAYAPGVSGRVYGLQRKAAATALKGGGSAIADGVFLRPQEREAIADVAREAGCGFTGFWLEADFARMVDRVATRRNDPSDATVDVLAAQAQHDPGPVTWLRIDASGGPEATLAAMFRHLAAAPG